MAHFNLIFFTSPFLKKGRWGGLKKKEPFAKVGEVGKKGGEIKKQKKKYCFFPISLFGCFLEKRGAPWKRWRGRGDNFLKIFPAFFPTKKGPFLTSFFSLFQEGGPQGLPKTKRRLGGEACIKKFIFSGGLWFRGCG